jgi:hypothetical protein
MSEYMSATEFERLQDDHRKGRVDVSIPHEVARQFFLRITSAEVEATTGRSIAFQKSLVWIASIASPFVFIACMVFFLIEHSAWEASLILPIAGICWTVIYGLTSAQGGWLIGTIPLAIVAIPIATGSATLTDPIFLFVLSIWLQRASYLMSAHWLMGIIMSHFEAFEMLEEHLQLETR